MPATVRLCHNNTTRTDCDYFYLVSLLIIYNNFINTSIGQKRSNIYPDAGQPKYRESLYIYTWHESLCQGQFLSGRYIRRKF